MMEIEALALYAYLRCGNQIINLLPPPKNTKLTQP